MTDQFIDTLRIISETIIPVEVDAQSRRCLLDYLGCTVAGYKVYSEKEKRYIDYMTEEGGACSVLGHHIHVPMQNAALLNGISAHAVELDDGHRIGMIHLGAPIISALLAVAEKENMSSQDFLRGIIIGYEAAIRLACAIQPDCKLKGFHATGVCGTVGAAMAIVFALKLSNSQIKSALAAAITSASGLLEMIEGDTELKPYNAGQASLNGLTAAYIGRSGFKAPKDPLGGKRGFLKVFGKEIKEDCLYEKGNTYCIETIYNKPYASCRHTHPAIEAAIEIRKNENFVLEDVEYVKVRTYKLAVGGHDHTKIDGVNSAKMSIPYSLAVALVTGRAGMSEFSEEAIEKNDVLTVASLVEVTDDEKLTALCPAKRVAEVEIGTKTQVFRSTIEYPKGEPENPLSSEEFLQKFRDLMLFGGYSLKSIDMCLEIVSRPEFRIKELMRVL